MNVSKFILTSIMSVSLFTQVTWAQMASTEALYEKPATLSQKEKVIKFMAREDVMKTLAQMGVDQKMVETRVASMTDEEAEKISHQIQKMPAGGDAVVGLLGLAVLVFVILLITDILGLTKVFSFTKPVQ